MKLHVLIDSKHELEQMQQALARSGYALKEQRDGVQRLVAIPTSIRIHTHEIGNNESKT